MKKTTKNKTNNSNKYNVRNCAGRFTKLTLRKGSLYKVEGTIARFRGMVGSISHLGLFSHHSFVATKPVSLAKKATKAEVQQYLNQK